MALVQVSWSSAVLGKAVGMNVILPECGKPPYPVFYLLHGLSDDHTIWERRTRLECYVASLPLIVVMPDGFRGFYTRNEAGPDYATYMAEEVPAFVERSFQAIPERAGRCIGGLSMGGYGAMRLALGYPDRFVSATSHSGALLPFKLPADDAERLRIFGASPEGTEHDPRVLARRAKAAGKLPAIRIDCGHDDFLLDQNRAFRDFLKAEAIPHEYAEFPGAHSWDYWDVHVREALAFHRQVLRLG